MIVCLYGFEIFFELKKKNDKFFFFDGSLGLGEIVKWINNLVLCLKYEILLLDN